MKEILFATGNTAKVDRFYEKLLKNGILLKSLKDININIDIEENGKNAIENAMRKAKAYYDATKITTMAMDDTMYIDGIPEEKQSMIFDKFNQVIDDSSKQKNGSGLGLTITKHLIDLHGGEIYVESKVGEGSEFIIILPVNNN